MKTMYLHYFSKDKDFPFFIQYGHHDNNLFMHTHTDFSELAIVLNGTAEHIVDKERFLVQKGDVFIISNDIAHGYENPKDFKLCNIMYRPNNLLWFDNDIRKSAGFHSLFVIEPYLNKDHRFQSRLTLSPSNFETISTIIDQMIHEYELRPESWRTMLRARFMQLVVLLSRAYDIRTDNTENLLNIALPIAYMESHFTESLTIEELAKQANLSVRHFSRLFHDAYHISPTQYLIQLRIQYACTLLKNNNLTISEVGFKSGFNDSNYFVRQFKKCTNLTPGQYRKFHLSAKVQPEG